MYTIPKSLKAMSLEELYQESLSENEAMDMTLHCITNFAAEVSILWKVSKSHNKFMKSSFLTKYERNIFLP